MGGEEGGREIDRGVAARSLGLMMRARRQPPTASEYVAFLAVVVRVVCVRTFFEESGLVYCVITAIESRRWLWSRAC